MMILDPWHNLKKVRTLTAVWEYKDLRLSLSQGKGPYSHRSVAKLA